MPFVRNNLAMAHFFNFVASTRQIKDPKGAGLDALKPIVESFESCVENLKRSVSGFERFDFDDLSVSKDGQAQEVSLERINQKLFVDEFFSLEPRGQIVPANI